MNGQGINRRPSTAGSTRAGSGENPSIMTTARGFQLKDLCEDTGGSGPLHEMNIPTSIAERMVKSFA